VRSYGQFCGLARALDVVGDRRTLLIVRELLIREPCRYTDLAYGLPGIATNLLVERLRQLEDHGLVTREAAPPPVATTVYRLTERGRALRPVIGALGRWGRPLLGEPVGDAEFRSHWLALPLEANLRDHTPDEPPVTIELRTGDQPMVIQTADGGVRVRPGIAAKPDAVVSGDPSLVVGVLTGAIDLVSARAGGLLVEGKEDALRRVQPAIPASKVESAADSRESAEAVVGGSVRRRRGTS
jgi:DNA-binding HxlR family transcriptional regulator